MDKQNIDREHCDEGAAPSLSDKLSKLYDACKSKVEPQHSPYPAYILGLSASDGKKRAITVHASDQCFDRAWAYVIDALSARMSETGLKGEHLRLDWVRDVRSFTWKDLASALRNVKRNYSRKGLSFDRSFQHMFLEQEVNAQALLYGGNGTSHCVINRANINLALRQKYGADLHIDYGEDEEVFLFNSDGIYCDAAGDLHPLISHGRDTGRRIIADLNQAVLQKSIQTASAFLENQIKDDGRFIYGLHPCFDREIPAYNALRHASTLYAMLEAWEVTSSPSLLTAIEKSLHHLRHHLIRHKNDSMSFIVEENEEVKLGANATALLALCKYASLLQTDIDQKLMNSLANGILFMQDADGSFRHVLEWLNLTTKDRFRVIYYEGEAAFALMRLYEVTKNERWIEAVEAAFEHFIKNDHWQYHDHWLSYCTNELTRYRNDMKYFDFGVRNFAGHLDFISNRITTFPTLLELLNAGREMLDRMRDLGISHEALSDENERLYQAAHKKRAAYLFNGYFWPEMAMFFRNPDRIMGSFFIRHHAFRVRIDDVEHYLSGLIGYAKLLKAGRLK